ncbi:MAG: tetratricopeptide repeat protein [Nitrospirota bacterium]|nr:tetratricopeptide repeat protein [Nitrospirota bacterium]
MADTLQQALQLQRAGQTEAAETLYRTILERQPGHPAASYQLGVLLLQRGAAAQAVDLLGTGIRNLPDQPGLRMPYGIACFHAGRLDDAADAFRHELTHPPDNPLAHFWLGMVLSAQGHGADAAVSFKHAVALRPAFPEAHLNLGRVCMEAGDLAQAEKAFATAVQLAPTMVQAHIALGLTLGELGRHADSIRQLQQAVTLAPESAIAHYQLGRMLCLSGSHVTGIKHLRNAVERNPEDISWRETLGRALFDARDFSRSADTLEQVLETDPQNISARALLSAARVELDDYSKAMAQADQVLATHPEDVQAWFTKATVYERLTHQREAIACYQKVLEMEPDNYKARCDITMMECYRTDLGPDGVLRSVRRLAERMERGLPDPDTVAHPNSRAAERRLTVGFVSPDLRTHSVAYFAEKIFARHDPGKLSIHCYAHLPKPDESTRRLRGMVDHWVDIGPMSDAQAVAAIRKDRVDILIDLAGHTHRSRVEIFAHRPAPVQVTYLGSPISTGLRAMDYRITDIHADPPEHDGHCSEQLVRLPHSFLCYSPPAAAPEPGPPPMRKNGHVTFGSFNNFSKFNPEVAEVWARVLSAVPGSRLLMKSRAFTTEAGRERCQEMFAGHGIHPDRLDLRAWFPGVSGHLGAYHLMDIALDTFPYNGTTTTCEALWMGVPVITLEGTSHMGRVGVSLLKNMDLEDLIAPSTDAYVELAAALAADPERLATLHRELRDRMASSRLCDGDAFAQDFEHALREMWRTWCRTA